MITAQSSRAFKPDRKPRSPTAEMDGILLDGIDAGDEGRQQAIERMRLLHPKLHISVINKRLEDLALDGDPRWSKAGFWQQEIDYVLLGGIHHGIQGQREAIRTVRAAWPALPAEILECRMQQLAAKLLPDYLRHDFWTPDLDEILLAGLRGGKHGERLAIGKILKLHPELRVGVVRHRLRRLARRVPKQETRRGSAFPWTAELDGRLIDLCSTDCLAAVTELQRLTGWPRHVIYRRAHKLGIPSRQGGGRRWTIAERTYLIEHVNHQSIKNIAKGLDRSAKSVWRKIEEMGLSGKNEEGFSAISLAGYLRVRPATVRKWIKANWLKRGRDGRIKERVLIAFLREHGHELKLDEVEPYIQSLLQERVNPEKEEADIDSAAEAGAS